MSHKYNAKSKVVDGIKFSSKKEANRYIDLKTLQKAGVITDLQLQPKFRVQDGFIYNGERIRPINYTADFKYYDTKREVTVVEEVKGYITQDFMLRWKIILNKFKDDDETIFILM
jgi:hypothetical protein